MKNILLATDFSDNSKNAINYAIRLFGFNEVSYTLLNTYMEPRSTTNVVVSMGEVLQRDSIAGLDSLLEELHDTFGYENLTIERRTQYGHLSNVINILADEYNYDFVVIGTKGASALENFLLGSNTIDVIKSIKLPTLVVPEGIDYSVVEKIVFAADYEHIDQLHLLDPLTHVAKIQKSELLILNVQKTNNSTDYVHAIEAFALHGVLKDVLHRFCVEVNESVVEGIDNFAMTNDAQLLCLVARKHDFFDRLFHRSITKQVSMLADIPLLIIHE